MITSQDFKVAVKGPITGGIQIQINYMMTTT